MARGEKGRIYRWVKWENIEGGEDRGRKLKVVNQLRY